MKNLFYCTVITVLCFCVNVQSQNTTISKNIPLSTEQLSFLKSTLGANDGTVDSLWNEYKLRNDSNNVIVDTITDSIHDTLKVKEELSVYEKIARGVEIHPDTVLSKITFFGYESFQSENTPNYYNSVAIPEDYPINSGDKILISLWGRINTEYRLTVNRNGAITIPKIGPLSLVGMSYKDMKRAVQRKVESIGGVKSNVSIESLHDIKVFITGMVNKSGVHIIPALTDIPTLLTFAEGVTAGGSLRNIYIKRNGNIFKKFDMYDFLIHKRNFQSFRLKNNDVLVVPSAGNIVSVAGNVRLSAIYEIKGRTTLKELIELAGGFAPSAWTHKIEVQRFTNNVKKIYDIDVKDREYSRFVVKDGDIVKVYPIKSESVNSVYLSGNVKYEGKYEIGSDMRIRDLIRKYDCLLPDTYYDYVLIQRRDSSNNNPYIMSVNLGNALQDSMSEDNVLLQPVDSIVIFTHDFFDPHRSVTISGAVSNEGKYKIVNNLRIKDLVLLSGGLLEEASSVNGEIYRRTYMGDVSQIEKISFNVSKAMLDDPMENHQLEKGDKVFIRTKKGWEKSRRIALLGEFNYPGEYVLLDNETLGDLIERAGGFKSSAYLPAAVLLRESIKELEKKRNDEYSRQLEHDILALSTEFIASGGNTSDLHSLISQQKSLLSKLKTLEPTGRLVVDFTQEDTYKGLSLENLDTLIVPQNSNTISVIGEVFNPATFVLNENDNTVKKYVNLSGGLKDGAHKRRIYIIKANGSVRTRDMISYRRYRLSPGDAIVVPRKLPRNYTKFRTIIETIGSVVNVTSNTAALISTVLTIKKLNE